MKKKLLVIILLAVVLESAIFSASKYNSLSLYLRGGVGVDTIRPFVSYPSNPSFHREGIAIKGGVDGYINEEDGKNFGLAFRLGSSIPFLVSSDNAGYPGKAMSLSFGGGIIFRARPWDYMDLTLSALLNLSTYDYRSIVLGVSIEPRFDLYLSDNLFLSVGGEYGSAIDRFLCKDAFLDRGFSEARFSFTLGVGYAFGGYSG